MMYTIAGFLLAWIIISIVVAAAYSVFRRVMRRR